MNPKDDEPPDRPLPRARRVDDEDDRPRRRRGGGSGVPCPKCGSRDQRNGPWPWYLGSVGAVLCKAVICEECGHEFDAKKPKADLATRKRNLALGINGCGLLGIVGVIGLLVLWVMYLKGQ
jgi:hypothetical protein